MALPGIMSNASPMLALSRCCLATHRRRWHRPGKDAAVWYQSGCFAGTCRRPAAGGDRPCHIKVARGNILAARQRGEPIPEGWALDADGNPTTDANAALAGSMVPMADAKGAALALMIEVLAAALTGSAFADEASSFFEAEGTPPNTGQVMLAIDPGLVTGDMAERLAGFAARIEADGGRLPGSSRVVRRGMAVSGFTVDKAALAAACDIARSPWNSLSAGKLLMRR